MKLSAPGAALLAENNSPVMELCFYGPEVLRCFHHLPELAAWWQVSLQRCPKGVERVCGCYSGILDQAQPIGFAAECLSWFRAGRDRPDSDRMFTESDAEKLCKTLAL